MPANLELQEYEYDTPLAMQNKDPPRKDVLHPASGTPYRSMTATMSLSSIAPQPRIPDIDGVDCCDLRSDNVHPQMLDIMSMSQFLLIPANRSQLKGWREGFLNWFRYLVTRFLNLRTFRIDVQMVGFMQSMFAKQMLKNPYAEVYGDLALDAGLTKQTLYRSRTVAVHSIDI